MQLTREQLKLQALSISLFLPTSLGQAIKKLGFVQIDPIRSPAPAQDLILRHRVKDYRVGDIDKAYESLELEEDFLYAHGYITRELWRLLHPRSLIGITDFDKEVLQKVQSLGAIHPRDLASHSKQQKVIGWWGVKTNATKLALDRLHYYGLIRVVRREKGIRIYSAFIPDLQELSPEERLSQLIMAVVRIHAPITDIFLQESLHRLRRHFGKTRPIIDILLKKGALQRHVVDGITYFSSSDGSSLTKVPQAVKILTPFDPVVRDRIRFEHLWGWQYRFEAYTPQAKRVRGYYAMPVLWGTEIIGWANLKVSKEDLTMDLGFIDKPPKSKSFEQELEQEIHRMKVFLNLCRR